MELKPLFKSGTTLLIGLREDYSENQVDDGLVLEIDIETANIINTPWSGQKKLKFGGHYLAINADEEPELLQLISKKFSKEQINEMLDLR